jgi:cytochrome P450
LRAASYSQHSNELFAPDVIDDPYPLYARLRTDQPISRIADTGVHAVATWELIDEVLGREFDFSANLTGVLIRGEDGEPGVFDLPGLGGNHVIATADEPHHAVHRALAQPRLAAPQTKAMEAPIREWCQQAITTFVEGGGGDVIPIAELIPARAVARVLGLPDGDVSRHRAWAMMGGDILAGGVSREQLIRLATETGQMAEYLGEHLDASPSAELGDAGVPLLAALAGGVARGEINRVEAVGIAIVMFGAAGESTAALIGSAIKRLAEAPRLASELRETPALIPRFIEEVARLDAPFKFHYRAVRRPCELGGVSLDEGDRLMLLWAAANRDPARFEEPDTLLMNRRHPKQHLSFGRGSHFCIGAPLARLETRIVLECLLEHTSDFTIRSDAPGVYARSIFIRRLEKLALDVSPSHA